MFTAFYDNDNPVATWNSETVTHAEHAKSRRVGKHAEHVGNNDGNMTFGPLPGESSFVNYAFDARNRLTGVGGVIYTYDLDVARQRGDGALTGVPGAKRRVRRAGALWASDEQNNRIAKTTADGTTTYVFDPHGDALPRVLVRERPDESLTFYVYGIGLLYEVDENDNATYYHFDQSGSTIALTNDAGEVTDRVEYTPYGTISHRTGETDTPFLYAGQFGIQADPNGLLHMRARYYSPELKRFINADPAGFGGGMNWYAYANNSPLMYVDASGEVPILAAVLVGMVVGGSIDAVITGLVDYINTGSVDSGRLIAAFGRGAIAGGVSAIAAPVSGTLILSNVGSKLVRSVGLRATSNGFASRGLSVGLSGLGSSVGQVNFNLQTGEQNLFRGSALAFAGGSIGQSASNLIKTSGFNTINQVNKFKAAPRNPSGFINTPNGRALSTGFATSSTTSTIISSFK